VSSCLYLSQCYNDWLWSHVIFPGSWPRDSSFLRSKFWIFRESPWLKRKSCNFQDKLFLSVKSWKQCYFCPLLLLNRQLCCYSAAANDAIIDELHWPWTSVMPYLHVEVCLYLVNCIEMESKLLQDTISALAAFPLILSDLRLFPSVYLHCCSVKACYSCPKGSLLGSTQLRLKGRNTAEHAICWVQALRNRLLSTHVECVVVMDTPIRQDSVMLLQVL